MRKLTKGGTLLLISLGFLEFCVLCEASNCANGWFGTKCQYMCHCRFDVLCDDEGQCEDGRCDPGWFGPGCQYVDCSHERKPYYLTTNDGVSCSNSNRVTSIPITFTKLYPFTWIRLLANSSELLHDIKLEFRNYDNKSGWICANPRKAIVDERTVDIYCETSARVLSVTLTGDGIQYVCSLYISGGRNVALKQNTEQYDIYENSNHSSDLAVDGIKGLVDSDPSCTISTATDDRGSIWILRFSKLKNVYKYLIYSDDSYQDSNYPSRGGLVIESYGARGPLFIYSDETDNVYRRRHLIEILADMAQVSSVVIRGSELWLNELVLCEVEVYGDSACQPKWYGRDCEHRCNCAGDESCFVSTGGCPSGCADGYTGEACNKPCSSETYGSGCNFTCSELCARETTQDRSCDFVNGTCLFGCVSGYEGQTCEKPCSSETYGPGCNFTCSEFCARETTQDRSCDFVNGTCLFGCVSGYEGQICEKRCRPGRYGQNCNSTCSEMCKPANGTLQSLCDSRTGHCLNGCSSRFMVLPVLTITCFLFYFMPFF